MTKQIWTAYYDILGENGKLIYFNDQFEGSKPECLKYIKKHDSRLHLGYTITDNKFFYSNGESIENTIPEDCIKQCSCSGDVSESVREWVLKLEFSLPSLKQGRDYLREFGAWDNLESADMFTLSQRVLWCACCEISERKAMGESGEWLGLNN